jgi:AcrR family transcriptional regulator
MARARPPDRFQQLFEAGQRVFTRKGVRRARMQDVAREMGVSPGNLYNYVESKEALFHWIVERGADVGDVATPAKLPIRAPSRSVVTRRLRAQLAASFRLPVFEAAERRRTVADPGAELLAVAGELYDRIARNRRPMVVVERSAIDLPALFDVYFVELRRAYFARLARWIARRQRAGHLRRDVDPVVAARVLVESITFFARHRFGDADPQRLPADDVVREGVLRVVVAGLLPTARPRRSRK